MRIEYLFPNILRFILIIVLQAFVFNTFAFQIQGYHLGKIFIFPLFIAFLPISMSSVVVVLLSFLLGISIDILTNSPGVYASATTLLGFARIIVLKIYEPRGGYKVNTLMSHVFYGRGWYYKTMGWLMFIGIGMYYLAELFTLSNPTFLLINIICSFITSGIIIFLISLIIRPKL